MILFLSALAMTACETGTKVESGTEVQTNSTLESDQKPKSDPNTYVAEYYKLVNQTNSDVVIKFRSDEVMTIKSGEEREIQKWDMIRLEQHDNHTILDDISDTGVTRRIGKRGDRRDRRFRGRIHRDDARESDYIIKIHNSKTGDPAGGISGFCIVLDRVGPISSAPCRGSA